MQMTPVPTAAPTSTAPDNVLNLSTYTTPDVTYARDWGPWWHTVTTRTDTGRTGCFMNASFPNRCPAWGWGIMPKLRTSPTTDRIAALIKSRRSRTIDVPNGKGNTRKADSAMLYSGGLTPRSLPLPTIAV